MTRAGAGGAVDARRFTVVCDIPFASGERERIAAATPHAEIDFRATSTSWNDVYVEHDYDLHGVEVLISHFPPRDWERAPDLRWIQTDSAGVDYLVGNPVWSRDLIFTNAAGAYATQIGQYVIAYVVSVAEQLRSRGVAQSTRSWPSSKEDQIALVGQQLRGQRAVIVGYGGIGREVARLAHAIGMEVVALKADPKKRRDDSFCLPGTGDPDGLLPTSILGIDSLHEAAGEADFLILALPLTDRTRGLVDTGILDALRPSAWIVNVARGAIVDQTALIRSLRSGGIGGAVLDVFDEEPLSPSSELWSLENAIVTPHVAGGGAASRELFSHVVVENLRRYAAHGELINTVDPKAGY